MCVGQNQCGYWYGGVKLLPFFLLSRTFNLLVPAWMWWGLGFFETQTQFLRKDSLFLLRQWVRGTSALDSFQALLINLGPQNLGSVVTIPKASLPCYLSFGSVCWGSLHTFILHFSAWLGFATKILFRNDDVKYIFFFFLRRQCSTFPPVVHSSSACGQVSKEPHLHMVLLDNPLSTIFSSHSVAFLPVATFLSLHQLAQWFIQQASSLEVMVHN